MILFNGEEVRFKKFPNGETIVVKKEFEKRRWEDDCLTLQYENDDDLLHLLLIKKELTNPCELHVTYFPYSRMDRKNLDYGFTLKSVAQYINWLDFDFVTVFEPHSDVLPALLNKCTIVDAFPWLLERTDFDPKLDFVMYPDSGAQKRYSQKIKCENEIVGFKTRDFRTGKIEDVHVVNEKSFFQKRVFIVDDLCSKGTTFFKSYLSLNLEKPSEIFLVVAHCEDTIFKGDVLNFFDKVYTTDSICSSRQGEEPKIVRISLSDLSTLTF